MHVLYEYFTPKESLALVPFVSLPQRCRSRDDLRSHRTTVARPIDTREVGRYYLLTYHRSDRYQSGRLIFTRQYFVSEQNPNEGEDYQGRYTATVQTKGFPLHKPPPWLLWDTHLIRRLAGPYLLQRGDPVVTSQKS